MPSRRGGKVDGVIIERRMEMHEAGWGVRPEGEENILTYISFFVCYRKILLQS